MSFKNIKENWVAKNRVYKLKGDFAPPLRQIRSKHTYDNHLMYWDEDTNENKELRFYASAKSPFKDDQPGKNVRVEHIYFREGYLFTERTDVALQQFLSIHPDNGRVFEELKPEKDAEEQVVDFEARAKAYQLMADISFDELEALMYDEIGDEVFKTTSKELKRDAWVIADESPEYFITTLDDATLVNKFVARKAEKYNIISIVDGGRSVRWASNKHKICTVDVDSTPYAALAAFFLTDDGHEVKAKVLEKLKKFE